MKERETLGSRLGFILLSAGCAIGLGNVWRFPYITGQYGGAIFVLIYLAFLVLLGLPIIVMEFAVGRAAKASLPLALKKLSPPGTIWHWYGPFAIVGNYLLMMFYSVITGWLLAYCYYAIKGQFVDFTTAEQTSQFFGEFLSSPFELTFWMILAVVIGFGVCSLGVRKGVEGITKYMMLLLLIMMGVLAVNSICLNGGAEGLKFYLVPNIDNLLKAGVGNVLVAAMGQAFFSLSVGIGSMAIFGSYMAKERSLTGESIYVVVLDTLVAIISGLIIFPACFAYGVNPGAGPSLLFITLPSIFAKMPCGMVWCCVFFLFMAFAALSTLIAVFENIIGLNIDVFKIKRSKAVLINMPLIMLFSIPCVLGFNEWAGFKPFGEGSCVLDLEDFLVSNVLLPFGALLIVCFCTMRMGWGWSKFIEEADQGNGVRFPKWLHWYCTIFPPIIILIIFLKGIIDKIKVFF